MSSADLYEDGFPHATREGYDRGCRGKNCPGTADHGRSCVEAYTRYQGDYTFRKRTDAGLTPDEIAAAELADRESALEPKRTAAPAVKATAPPKPKPQPRTPAKAAPAATTKAAPAARRRRALADEATSDQPMAEGHGTTAGYAKGCHGTACPSKVAGGISCSEAKSAKMREYFQKRKAAKAIEPAEPPAPTTDEQPTQQPPVVVDEPSPQIVHIGTRQLALRIATDESGAVNITIHIPAEASQ